MQDSRWGASYPSAEMQLVYSTALADWANLGFIYKKKKIVIHGFCCSRKKNKKKKKKTEKYLDLAWGMKN